MSASDQMRNMISELMGTTQDGGSEKAVKLRFDDSRVCKSFLLKCCPHDILSSTRMDMGECSKIHNVALRADYENASVNKDYRYDVEAYNKLNIFITDLDKKVELAKVRLKETQAELSEEANAKAEVIHNLGEKIGITLAKAEQLGADGEVDQSMLLLEEVEVLKKQKLEAEIEYRNVLPASTYQQQKLRVCEICSAYLGIHDNDRRLADHFGGKLHMGFIDIRDKLEELREIVEKKREERARAEPEGDWRNEPRKPDGDAEPRQRSRSASRRSKSRSRNRSRSRDRGSRRRRSRSRSRERSKKHSRSRRSRSRSGSRRHSKSKHHRRSRSGSRSRHSKHRSKPVDDKGDIQSKETDQVAV